METRKYTTVRGRAVYDAKTKQAYNHSNLPDEVGERLIKIRPDVVITIANCRKYGNPTTEEWDAIREQLMVITEKENEVEPKKTKRNAKVGNGVGGK